MSIPEYRRNRFDSGDQEPVGPLDNLADIMLVFAVGLMVALAASDQRDAGGITIEAGQEMPELPAGAGQSGEGYEAVGQVFRDPETGKLFLIGE